MAHGPLAVLDAKAGVLVGQLVALGVLFPQQLQGDAGAFELLVNDSEVGGELMTAARQGRPKQAGFKLRVAEGLCYGPVNPGCASERDVLAGRALGYLELAGNLAVAQPCLQVQAQCLSNLAHRDSVRWHWLLPQKAVSLGRVKEITCARPIKSSTFTLKQRPRSI